MADYFAALAARTLRPELSVQPRRHVRWEEVPDPVAEAFPSAADVIARRVRPSAPDEGEPPRRSRRTSAAEASPPEGDPAAPRPTLGRDRRIDAGDRDDTIVAMASTPHPTVRALEPVVRVRLQPVAARLGDAVGRNAVTWDGRRATAAPSRGVERARPQPARLSARERESASEPVIRIHIGRVDVRAVTAAASGSPPAPRDHTRALMSLDDYVQKRDRGAS